MFGPDTSAGKESFLRDLKVWSDIRFSSSKVQFLGVICPLFVEVASGLFRVCSKGFLKELSFAVLEILDFRGICEVC